MFKDQQTFQRLSLGILGIKEVGLQCWETTKHKAFPRTRQKEDYNVEDEHR